MGQFASYFRTRPIFPRINGPNVSKERKVLQFVKTSIKRYAQMSKKN